MNGKGMGTIIKESFGAFSNNWGQIVGAYVLSMGSLLGLMLFPAFGLFLAFFAMGFLCVGQKKFVLSRLTNKGEPIEIVFGYFKHSISAFCLKTLIILFSLLWGLLLIIPGIICFLNYSFASFIFAENPNKTAFEVLEESKTRTAGQRGKIFFLALFSFLLALGVGAIGYCLSLLIGLAVTLPVWAIVLFTVIPFVMGFVLLGVPFFEIAITKVYLETQKPKTNKRSKQLTQASSQE